jgi:hypothetical protein
MSWLITSACNMAIPASIVSCEIVASTLQSDPSEVASMESIMSCTEGSIAPNAAD